MGEHPVASGFLDFFYFDSGSIEVATKENIFLFRWKKIEEKKTWKLKFSLAFELLFNCCCSLHAKRIRKEKNDKKYMQV